MGFFNTDRNRELGTTIHNCDICNTCTQRRHHTLFVNWDDAGVADEIASTCTRRWQVNPATYNIFDIYQQRASHPSRQRDDGWINV